MLAHARIALCLAGVAIGAAPGATSAAEPELRFEVRPREATVGDRLQATLSLVLPSATEFTPRPLGPRLGPFSVYGERWEPVVGEGETRWIWRAQLSAWQTGELTVPPVRLTLDGADGAPELTSEPLSITVRSLLDDTESDDAALADLKPPVSVPPDFAGLRLALGLLAVLAALAGLLWWLHRRYAARFAAVAPVEDPFRRVPPHEWVYQELQRLLARRLAEGGQVDLFYAELSRILKRYLGGRYRVDLLERTSDEVPEVLRQAGAPERATTAVRRLLEDCDRVKFARERPDPAAWRVAVESVYSIVDGTRPVDAAAGAA